MSEPYNYSDYERLRRQQERKQKEKDIEDIDAEINWAYSNMRIIEHHLEEALETSTQLSDKDHKRIDKALVITRTGLKMLKKVIKTRAPEMSTSAWKSELRKVM